MFVLFFEFNRPPVKVETKMQIQPLFRGRVHLKNSQINERTSKATTFHSIRILRRPSPLGNDFVTHQNANSAKIENRYDAVGIIL